MRPGNKTAAPMAALLSTLLCLAIAPSHAAVPDATNWPEVLREARGQTVYWHAWGGEQRINDYIHWASEQVEKRYGVAVAHVKLSDTAEAVTRVLAEKSAGRHTGGSVDLIWINGENFAAMKRNGLLYGPWAEAVPNFAFVDVEAKPTVRSDFTVPTEGFEAPWNMAQLVLYFDSARVPEPPRSAAALLVWVEANPGRFTFPQPPNFLGTTVLKQLLYEMVEEKALLTAPVEESTFGAVSQPLWDYLDALTPKLWRSGRAYPQNSGRQRSLMADGEIDLAMSFNPSEASAAIANGELPDSIRTAVFDAGTIGNTSFVAIPFNASHKAGAMVLADFLMSPEAQAYKQDPSVWGGFTVLAVDRLPAAERRRFDALDLGVATLSPQELGTVLPEPHPSWMIRIEEGWTQRYGAR